MKISLAAAGGLMSAALGPAAVAYADGFDPSTETLKGIGEETLTSLYNMKATPPAVDSSLQGYQEFSVLNSSGASAGDFYAYESTAPYLAPLNGTLSDQLGSSQVLYVDSDVPGATGDSVLPNGTIIATSWSFGDSVEHIYEAIPASTPGGADTIVDVIKTPLGTIDLSNLVSSLFDTADLSPVLPADISGIGDPTVTGISGLPPLDVAVQGVQNFSMGDGTFTALETTTKDGIGFSSEALLVTQDLTGTAGTADGDVLPVGSVVNTLLLGKNENVYISSPGADGKDVVTDYLENTKTGHITDLTSLYSSYDASAGLLDGSNIEPVTLAGGDVLQVDPGHSEVFTGINGLPPGDGSIQGTQLFELMDGTSPAGTAEGDVTTVVPMAFSNYGESILVTSSTDTSALPVGSIIDVTGYGSGTENVYTDLPGLGANGADKITDTLVTSFGDFNLSSLYQSTDASLGMTAAEHLVNFMDGSWLDLFHL